MILLLPKEDTNEWITFGRNIEYILEECSNKWKMLKEYIALRIFLRGTGQKIVSCFYPPIRPIILGLGVFENNCGCIVDYDAYAKDIDIYRDEVNRIPNDVYVCCISQNNKIVNLNKKNYFPSIINPKNHNQYLLIYVRSIIRIVFMSYNENCRTALEEIIIQDRMILLNYLNNN